MKAKGKKQKTKTVFGQSKTRNTFFFRLVAFLQIINNFLYVFFYSSAHSAVVWKLLKIVGYNLGMTGNILKTISKQAPRSVIQFPQEMRKERCKKSTRT